MARSVNKAIIVGNLGNDPEIRTTPNGARVATISVATNRRWSDKSGATKEETQWHRIIAWNSVRASRREARFMNRRWRASGPNSE